jgi:dTDP-4-amino-4,6-dideoxygalactose transaminase
VQSVPFVDLAAQHALIRDEIDEAVRVVLDSSWFVLGRQLEAFEEEFAAYCGVEHCVGVGSGTDALVLALRACGVGPGDEVITPSHTFFAGPLAIVSAGAVPVFVDIDEATYTIDAELAANAVGPRTRAIVPVHLYGRCADLGALTALAEERGLRLIEDAAQAHGVDFDGRAAGTVGDLGCFSFYPSKNLGACGDAGAVVTRDGDLAARLRLLRNYGQTRKYQHDSLGSNSRLDELQAAILRAKLPHLEAWNDARRRAAEAYAAVLDPAVCPPGPVADRTHVFHLYAIRTAGRDELQRYLAQHAVETQIHYPIPVHLQPAFRDVPHVLSDLRVTERVAADVLSLPMFPTISDAQIRYVADRVRAGLAETAAPSKPATSTLSHPRRV